MMSCTQALHFQQWNFRIFRPTRKPHTSRPWSFELCRSLRLSSRTTANKIACTHEVLVFTEFFLLLYFYHLEFFLFITSVERSCALLVLALIEKYESCILLPLVWEILYSYYVLVPKNLEVFTTQIENLLLPNLSSWEILYS